MVTVDQILGQKKPLEIIDRIIKLGKRGQALLLTGTAGIGKFAIACYTARRFLCQNDNSGCGTCFSCKNMLNRSHPDFLLAFPFPNVAGESRKNTLFHFSDPESSDARFSNETLDEVNRFIEEKQQDPYRIVSYRKKGNIPVSVIKDLIKAVGKRPMLGKRRAVVICDVDQMAFGASDLFLKTVEEPPENTLMILTTSKPQVLASTLLSRTTRIPLTPVVDGLIRNYLDKYNINGAVDFYIRFSFSSPGLALQAYEDDLMDRRDQLWRIFAGFLISPNLPAIIEKLKVRYQYAGYDEVRSDFDIAEKILRDIYIVKMGLDKKLINIDIKTEILETARQAPDARILRRWFPILARASRVHGINNVSPDMAFIGAFIEFDRAKRQI
jgi:hypothetical protein